MAPLTRRTTRGRRQGFCPLLRRFPGAVRPGPLYRDDEQGEASRESLHRLSPQPARATAVASYSTRAWRGALPSPRPSPGMSFRQKSRPISSPSPLFPALLAKLKQDPWKGFFTVRQSLTAKILASIGPMTFTPSCPSCLGGFSWFSAGNEASICSRASKPTGFTRW